MPALRRARPALAPYGISDQGGIIRMPDGAVEGIISPDEAWAALGQFFTHHCRWLHNPLLRRFYRNAEPHMWYLYDLGYLAQQRADLTTAVQLYTAALRVRPHPYCYSNRAVACSAGGDHAGAISDLTKAIGLAGDPADKAMVLHNRGNTYARHRQFSLAIADLTEALRLYESDADKGRVHSGLALLHSLTEDHAGALAEWGEAIRCLPDDAARAQAHFGRALDRFDVGDRAGAIADYTEGLHLFPDRASRALAYTGRGLARAADGELRAAIADFASASSVHPQYARAYYHSAAAWAQLNEPCRACEELARAIQLDPAWREPARTNPSFDSIRHEPCFQALVTSA